MSGVGIVCSGVIVKYQGHIIMQTNNSIAARHINTNIHLTRRQLISSSGRADSAKRLCLLWYATAVPFKRGCLSASIARSVVTPLRSQEDWQRIWTDGASRVEVDFTWTTALVKCLWILNRVSCDVTLARSEKLVHWFARNTRAHGAAMQLLLVSFVRRRR